MSETPSTSPFRRRLAGALMLWCTDGAVSRARDRRVSFSGTFVSWWYELRCGRDIPCWAHNKLRFASLGCGSCQKRRVCLFWRPEIDYQDVIIGLTGLRRAPPRALWLRCPLAWIWPRIDFCGLYRAHLRVMHPVFPSAFYVRVLMWVLQYLHNNYQLLSIPILQSKMFMKLFSKTPKCYGYWRRIIWCCCV